MNSRLNGLIETLKKVAALEAAVKTIDSQDNRKAITDRLEAEYAGREHKPDINSLMWVSLYGEARYKLEDIARTARYAVGHVDELTVDVALMERLQSALESLEVYANIDHGYGSRPMQDNTRELRLLEILVKSDDYDYERRKLQESIAETLNEVEEAEWEKEQENAIEALEKSGFSRVEDDYLDGYRRTQDDVVEEVVIETNTSQRRGIKEFGYKFSYEKKQGTTVVALVGGKSGEFGKLIEVATASPTAA